MAPQSDGSCESPWVRRRQTWVGDIGALVLACESSTNSVIDLFVVVVVSIPSDWDEVEVREVVVDVLVVVVVVGDSRDLFAWY